MRKKIVLAVTVLAGLALLHLVHRHLGREGHVGHGVAAQQRVQASP